MPYWADLHAIWGGRDVSMYLCTFTLSALSLTRLFISEAVTFDPNSIHEEQKNRSSGKTSFRKQRRQGHLNLSILRQNICFNVSQPYSLERTVPTPKLLSSAHSNTHIALMSIQGEVYASCAFYIIGLWLRLSQQNPSEDIFIGGVISNK